MNFNKRMMQIAVPITLQNLIMNSLNLVDTIMIGKLGTESIAAVGLANQVYFILLLIIFGTNSGLSIFISQFWGKRDIINIRKVLGMSLIVGCVASFVFMAASVFAPQWVLGIYSKDVEVIRIGSEYIRIVAFSYMMTAISFSYSFGLRSIGKPKLPLHISTFALLLNTGLNYVLIFGYLGFEPMGVRGAAIATLISRTLEAIILVTAIYYSKGVMAARIKEMLTIEWSFVVKVFRTSLPVILNEGFYGVGQTIYMIIYARMGTDIIASMQIVFVVLNVFMVFSTGLANAGAVMIGNAMGADNVLLAEEDSRKFVKVSFAIGAVLAVIITFSSKSIVSMYNVPELVQDNAQFVLSIFGVMMLARVYNIVLVIGLLRGGGDTLFSMLLESGCLYFVGIPLAFLGAFVFSLGIVKIALLIQAEELLKTLIGTVRYKSKKWAKNVVNDLAA